jgi:hypothetical protein
MAVIDGLTKRRISLVAGVAKTIHFGAGVYEVSLALSGSGKVAYKFGSVAPTSVDDDTSNFLNDDVSSAVIHRSSRFTDITFLSDSALVLQWDIDV